MVTFFRQLVGFESILSQIVVHKFLLMSQVINIEKSSWPVKGMQVDCSVHLLHF